MTKRYFKATDGTFTVFRASESRVYRYAWMRLGQSSGARPTARRGRSSGRPTPSTLGFTNAQTAPGHRALAGRARRSRSASTSIRCLYSSRPRASTLGARN